MPTARSLASWIRRNKVNRMTGFSIDFVSDMDHEHRMAEISFNGQRLCVLDKEGGNEEMSIEFLADLYVLPESVRTKFSLAEFLKTVEIARSDLEKFALRRNRTNEPGAGQVRHLRRATRAKAR